MGKFKSMFKKFLGFEDDDIDIEDQNVNLEEELNKQKTYYDASNTEEPEPRENRNQKNFENIYNDLHEHRRVREELVMYPKTFAEACDVVEKIENGYVVIVDMEDVEIDTCKRIADFVLGAVYVMQGDVDKVSKKVFRFWIDK